MKPRIIGRYRSYLNEKRIMWNPLNMPDKLWFVSPCSAIKCFKVRMGYYAK